MVDARETSLLALWFFPMQAPLKPITQKEARYAEQFSTKRSMQFHHSRGYVREALSELWKVPALEIPLQAAPGKAPKLAKGWGNVSFSHCSDGLFIGWSPKRIGVDLERADRCFKAEQVTKRYFSEQEKKDLSHLNQEELRAAVLQKWVIKEAAIKWQRGKLAADFSKWSFCEKSHLAIHQSLGHKVGLHRIQFNSWYMAVAFDKKIHTNPPIICKFNIKNTY